jgi:hypothetical protein
VLSLSLSLPSSKYADGPQINNFYNQMIESISGLPGVRSAAIAYDHPLQSNWIDAFTIEGRPQPEAGQTPSANFNPVSWDYFRTIGAVVVAGRQFTAQDDQDHPGVVIVNEAFVRRASARTTHPPQPARKDLEEPAAHLF